MKIEMVGESQIGSCYYQHLFKVTSEEFLPDEKIHELRRKGSLGYGQEFFFTRTTENGLHVVNATSRVDSSD